MKTPPTPDSPALLYLLALCGPGEHSGSDCDSDCDGDCDSDGGGGGGGGGGNDSNSDSDSDCGHPEYSEDPYPLHHPHHGHHPHHHHHTNHINHNHSHSPPYRRSSHGSIHHNHKHNHTHPLHSTNSFYKTYHEYFGSMDGLNKINPFSASGGGKNGKNIQDMNIDEIIRELRRLLPGALTRFHRFMLRAHKLMSTPSGIDKVLMTLSYTLQLVTAQLPATSPLPASCRTLASLISDMRVFNRLWGLLGIYSWGHSLLQHPPRDLTIRRIVAAQVLANAGFQVLENAAYLASHNVVRLGKVGQARLWVWSSRFWMTHVALEFWRLQRVRELRVDGTRRGLIGSSRKEEEGWKRELIANCAYAPLTLHWSVANGMIGPSAVGALGSVAAVIGLQNAWAATA